VIYSQWLDLTLTPDIVHNSDGTIDTISYSASMVAPKLDSVMLTTGEMKVYFNFGTSAQPDVVPLPFIFPISNGTVYLTPDFFVGRIIVSSNIDFFSSFTNNGSKFQQYRYILVPGSVNGRILKPNWKDYNAVKAFYGIKDY
jgi:hypothetical protein